MSVKVVIDSNVWISYFINERINYLTKWFLNESVEIFISDELIKEIVEVLQRPKFRSRKSKDDISDFINLLTNLGSNKKVRSIFKNSPDADDNFLFDLCIASQAKYLITSDKKLLNFHSGLELSIITFSEFRQLLSQQR
jgi:uncharacterized protein